MMNEPVSTIMKTQLHTATSDDSLEMIYNVMKQHKIHHVPILDGAKLVGLVTTHDLLRSNLRHEEYAGVKASAIMTKKVATVEPTSKVGTAAEIFLENRFHGLPVVNENHDLVGFLTTFDVLNYEFRKEYPNNPW
jgi:CBS domain-containing protein